MLWLLSGPPGFTSWICLLRYFAAVRPKVVVLLLLIVTPIVRICNCSMFCCALLCVHSSFVIILMGKRELVALLFLPGVSCLLCGSSS